MPHAELVKIEAEAQESSLREVSRQISPQYQMAPLQDVSGLCSMRSFGEEQKS